MRSSEILFTGHSKEVYQNTVLLCYHAVALGYYDKNLLLMKGMLAKEMNRRKVKSMTADTALLILEDLCTETDINKHSGYYQKALQNT